MKRMLLLLLILPLAFAQWEATAGLAIMTSVTLLAVVYMIGMGFGVNELQMMAKEELFQVIAVMLMLVLLVGSDNILNVITTNVAFKGTSTNMQGAALEILTDMRNQVETVFNTLRDVDHQVALQASKGGSCNVLQVGYSMSGCGGFSMLPTPLSMAGNIAGFALGELSAMIRLVQICQNYSMQFLLPLGIVLRTFKLTRGAGGFLIALAISLYLLVPMGVIFNEMMALTFLKAGTAADTSAELKPLVKMYGETTASPPVEECNELDAPGIMGNLMAGAGAVDCPASTTLADLGNIGAFVPGLGGLDSNDAKATATYCMLRAYTRGYLYLMLIRATLGPVIALLMMSAGIRTLTSIAGAEVDVSAISRFV
jgi:hypothetical protein